MVAVLALVVLVALGLGALGGSTSIETDEGSVAAPGEGGGGVVFDEDGGVVFGQHESGGISLFGLELQGRDRWLSVGFVAPAECIERDAGGAEVVVASGVCAGLPASGEVNGGGVTAQGVSWVTVRVDVSRECFEAVAVGEAWPSEAAGCREG